MPKQSAIRNPQSKISLIVAMSENRVIGRGNALPWRLPDDLKHFKRITTGHAVVMGRKTYDSMGKPLANRRNIVITRQGGFRAEGVTVAHSVEEAIAQAGEGEVFIIGGAEIYKAAMPFVTRMYVTLIGADMEGDTYFPEFSRSEWRLIEQTEHPADERHAHAMNFQTYVREV